MNEIGEGVVEGYLLLADISGYTDFLTGTELEHSHAIVTELTKLIRGTLAPPMQFVKLEGDAVFCFAPRAAFPNGELLVELVESCYFDFQNRLLNMTRSTTCPCDACREIGGLDLKFVAHYGSFIVDRDEDGRLDLTGPDVILVHRLLKNTVIESGGPTSYGFFTDPCATCGSTQLPLPEHAESYESFGEVTGVVQDLAAVADKRRASNRVRVAAEDADFVSSYVVDGLPRCAGSISWSPESDSGISRRWKPVWSSVPTARVVLRLGRRAIAPMARAVTVFGSISTGGPLSTAPAGCPRSRPRESNSSGSSSAWRPTSSTSSQMAERSIVG